MSSMETGGIVNIFKPSDMTSFGVVARIRRVTGIRRVGHCGTLDPFAEGVLPVLLGRSTGVARYMENFGKSYRVTVRFGMSTDTQDRTGDPVGGHMPSPEEWGHLTAGDFQAVRYMLASMTGEQKQKPPMYSAVKINGKKLYEYARKGQEVERPERTIHVYAARFVQGSTNPANPEITVEFDCSKGTYIRTLCQDMGEKTGFGAHADSLVRTACGPYSIDQSISLDTFMRMVEEDGLGLDALREQRILQPAATALTDMPSATTDRYGALRFINGQMLDGGTYAVDIPMVEGMRITVTGPVGFVGVGVLFAPEDSAQGLMLRAERVFADREDYQK